VSRFAWGIDSHELDARVHQAGRELDVTSQPVQLGNDECRSLRAAQVERRASRGAITPLAALYLDDLLDKLPPATIQIAAHGILLSFQPETTRPCRRVETR